MNDNDRIFYHLEVMQKLSEAGTCRVKIGCIIVKQNMIVAVGYNGSVHGDKHCDEHGCLLVPAPHQGSSDSGKSCIRTVHAELNAVLKCAERGSYNGWMESYSTYSPCLNCFKALLQIGVRRIHYIKNYKDEWRDHYMAALDPLVGVNMLKWDLETRTRVEFK